MTANARCQYIPTIWKLGAQCGIACKQFFLGIAIIMALAQAFLYAESITGRSRSSVSANRNNSDYR